MLPVPLTNALIATGAVALPLSEVAGAVLAGLGLLNQCLVEIGRAIGDDDGPW